MHFSKKTASALAGLVLANTVLAELPPITIKGTKFFYENGTQFFMKGIAYQQDVAPAGGKSKTKYTDPLADEDQCARDIPHLIELGTNTIRTYAIDPAADHSACMRMLDDAGIYVVSDLSEPVLSIDRSKPTWNVDLYDRYTAVIDELQQYGNVIGFFAGNEVSNDNLTTTASAFVKAAVRDMKSYISEKKYRPMGVGYAANDDKDIRVEIAHYFNCGEQSTAIDFWGYNIYSWCQQSSMRASGYDQQAEFFRNYSVPVFFAEYGCNVPDGAEGRIWQETTALYEDEMTEVFSGGIVYMYFQEKNDYGLVNLNGDKATPMKNFERLATVIADVNPSSTSADAYEPTNSPQACPGLSDTWKVNADSLPPRPDHDLCDCMFNSLGCVPSDNVEPENYGDIFDFVCAVEDRNLCAGIMANATMGVYGAYGMCSPEQQLGFVLNEYFNFQNGAATACDFKGQAVTQNGNTPSACESKLAVAASINAAAATATTPVTGVDGGASDGGNGDEDNFGVPSAHFATLFTIGDLAIGAYLGVAMLAGAGMVLM